MKRFLTIGIFLTVLTMLVTAQNTFSGLVKDTKGQAIPFATVQILKTDSTLVTGAITDDDGKYTLSFSSEETQKYLLHVSFVGYKTQVLHLDSKATDIRDIVLEEEATELSEVEVSAKRPLVERQVDKLVLNVSDSPFAIGSNGEELLKKAPGVNIDKDGNITVNGQSVAVYIDGRPSYLSGEQLKAMLESTDGSTIDKIEIITHPSSKYDAAGSGGIINIKTKRNMTRGVNGTLSTTYGGMYFDDIDKYLQRDNVSLNLHLRTEKTYTSLALTQNYNSGANTMETGSKVDDGNTAPLERYTQSRRLQTYQWYRLKISNDWFVDKKNTIGFIFNMPLSKWETEQNPQHHYSYLFRANDTLSSGTSDIKNLYKWRQYSSNINYTHIFNDSLDQEITFNLDYNRHSDDGNTNSLTESYSPSMPASHLKLHLNTDNYVNIYSAKADFQTNVWRTGKIEAGAKWSMTYTHNRLKTDSTINNTDQRPQKTTAFNYNEQIAALYFSIANRFGEHWNAKVGLRGEFTNSKGDWISADSTTKRSYFNLFPTAFVGYNPNQKMSFNLSYNRRIQRPSYDELNPFEDYTDAYTYQVGNPQLKPEFVHQAALDMNFTQYVSLEGGMLYGTDLTETKTDVLEGGITRAKPYNAGTVTAAFVGVSLT
ncbi:MAG: TonB-dependent receptor, partial [Paludibacteraceae bacterium]|nr:TonB-dependent receptor [Paludibacteraceae bacterium]